MTTDHTPMDEWKTISWSRPVLNGLHHVYERAT